MSANARNVLTGPIEGNEATARAATAIADAFDAYRARFAEITSGVRDRFERRDWLGTQDDAAARLALYRLHVARALAEVRAELGEHASEVPTWEEVKWLHAALIVDRDDCEIAETFFSSITRRVFTTVGVNAHVEYVLPEANPEPRGDESPITRCYPLDAGAAHALDRLLADLAWSVPFAHSELDVQLAAKRIVHALRAANIPLTGSVLEVLAPVFFRNKGAYVIGRVKNGEGWMPVVLPLLHPAEGIVIDAVLTTSDEVSIVFGFSWSYFFVEASRPRAVVEFLASIMPLKRIDELYNAIGFNKHGKTELYRSLVAHMARPEARFDFAEGDEGLVMSVFTLPSLNVVFKIIKDRFGHPKRITRTGVLGKYHLVFVRDRVGRLADAQEFEHLAFPRRLFSDALLEHLREVAPSIVRFEGESVIIAHLYTERRVTPLNVFLRDATPAAAADAILDYGAAIKDLAAANIFTGDMLLKNFGVSRHGRVIFYDYDELCLLTECNIRALPQPRTEEEEMAAEPWYYVGELDVFPEEFSAFLVPPAPLRDIFLDAHRDLLTVEYWRGMQQRQKAGEVVDVFPYAAARRLGQP
ncbi:MAG: bifunctional isocitrate dehydrogenase kinase/phosphatase [Gemmatimonadota bacterium]|nr:bifunctional isocitrate dehydrogenase kinase/phosphatase [Gemmatimonadota bacterium]